MEKLTENIDMLTSNCTMTGHAHDELHKWLLSYIDLVDEFSEVDTEQDGLLFIEKFNTMFSTFNQYFN